MNHLMNMIPPNSRAWPIMERWRWLPLILILAALAQCGMWAADRDPPFKLVSYQTWPVKTGGTLGIEAIVERDLRRDCYMELSSSIVDSIGVRWDLGTTQAVSPDGIRELDAKSPGKLLRKIQLPPGMAPGQASVLSSMTYRCNPLHDLVRPISVQTRFEFEVIQ